MPYMIHVRYHFIFAEGAGFFGTQKPQRYSALSMLCYMGFFYHCLKF